MLVDGAPATTLDGRLHANTGQAAFLGEADRLASLDQTRLVER
jgi:hypothetical protein